MEIWYLLITEKFLLWTFRRWEIQFFFSPKSWWKYIYWLLKSYCFELFGDAKYGLFLSQKVNRNMIFIDYWKVLVLNFSEIGNTVFFEPKGWWKYIHWLLKSYCFELFGDGKYGLFLSLKVNRNMIFTDYWKVLLLNFSEIGNTVFFLTKKFMKYRWYLLINENFLFWTFRW